MHKERVKNLERNEKYIANGFESSDDDDEDDEDDDEDIMEGEQETKDNSESIVIPATVAGILSIVIVTAFVLRARNRSENEPETWQSEDTEPVRDERIPEGWTLEEFLDWLDGPMPEEWEEDQWELYKSSLEDLR